MTQNHIAAVFVSHEAQTFAVTARSATDTNWRILDAITTLPGVYKLKLMEGATLEAANEFAKIFSTAYTEAGYTRLTLRRFIDDATAFEE